MAMPFSVPMVWREPSNHSSDCYFCLTPPVASGMNRKKKQRIDYPNIPSTIRPVPHGEDLPMSEPPKEYKAETRYITMSKRYGLSERFWIQDTKM